MRAQEKPWRPDRFPNLQASTQRSAAHPRLLSRRVLRAWKPLSRPPAWTSQAHSRYGLADWVWRAGASQANPSATRGGERGRNSEAWRVKLEARPAMRRNLAAGRVRAPVPN